MFSLVRPLPSSNSSAFASFAAFSGNMSRSDFSVAFMPGFPALPFPDRSVPSDTAEISRFPFRKFPNVHGVFDYAGTGHSSRSIAVSRFAFPTGLQGRRPDWNFRSSMSQPAGTAVYASIRISRLALQDSRPDWFATPYL